MKNLFFYKGFEMIEEYIRRQNHIYEFSIWTPALFLKIAAVACVRFSLSEILTGGFSGTANSL